MIKSFKEYIEEDNKDNKEILTRISDLLKRTKGVEIYSFLEREQDSYIFALIDIHNNDLVQKLKDIKLGIRIYIINDDVLYRLQQGPKGFPIGPAKKLINQEEIEDIISQGKNNQSAYNELIRKIPNKLKDFLTKIFQNIKKSYRSNNSSDNKAIINRKILNNILTSNLDPGYKI